MALPEITQGDVTAIVAALIALLTAINTWLTHSGNKAAAAAHEKSTMEVKDAISGLKDVALATHTIVSRPQPVVNPPINIHPVPEQGQAPGKAKKK